MSNIRVRLKSRQAIKVDNQKLYLYDPSLIDDEVELAKDWAIKTDGLVEEEDYSSKAWAIGGTGTETNNSKYYASQAATKAKKAATSASTATTQAGIATTQAGVATTKAGEASTSATNAYNSASQASTSATNAYNSAGQAATSATSASNSADQSKQWAIGVPTEPADGSAKYWAGQAQSAVESIGDATLTIQKNGSDLGTFTANATVDKTIDIPIPTVNNSTISFTQGGVSKGSFTLNQSSGATIDFDASSGAPSFATITGQPTDNANLASALSAKYDASNPDGYQANVIETVKVNGTALTPVSKAVDVTVPTKTSDLTNDDGFITGITSSDVSTALGYTPADDSGVVHNTGDEAIGGVKTFTNMPWSLSNAESTDAGGYTIQNIAADTTTAPSAQIYNYLRYKDANNAILGDIDFIRGTDGSQTTRIMARSAISGSEVSAYFGVVSGAGGTGSVNGSRNVLRSIGNLIMPSTSAYSDVTVKSSGSSYTAPNTGYIFVSISRSAASWVLSISANNMLAKGTANTNNNTNSVTAWLPVKKGDSYTVTYSGQSSISIKFVSAVLEE